MEAKHNSHIYEVSDADFDQTVIARSHQVSVILDLWAPWCGPCRMLAPMLEQQVAQAAGKVVLAKLNTDENPATAERLEVRGIPDVRGYRGGREVARFVGVQPKSVIDAFMRKLVPSEADALAAAGEQALRDGKPGAALTAYRKAHELEPGNSQIRLGLATALLELDQIDEAGTLLQAFREGNEGWDQAQGLLTVLEFRRLVADAGGFAACEARAEANPRDPEALYGRAGARFIKGDTPGALDALLEVVKRDRRWRDDLGRKTMLRIFELIGNRSALSDEYRSRLATVLY